MTDDEDSTVRVMGRLVYASVALWVLNLAVALVVAVYTLQRDQDWLAVAALSRAVMALGSVLLLMSAMRLARREMEIYREHCRFMRAMMLVQSGHLNVVREDAEDLRVSL